MAFSSEMVAPGVYSYVQPDGTWFINNMGFIAGSSAVVSIDTTSTERRNRAYLDEAGDFAINPFITRGVGHGIDGLTPTVCIMIKPVAFQSFAQFLSLIPI